MNAPIRLPLLFALVIAPCMTVFAQDEPATITIRKSDSVSAVIDGIQGPGGSEIAKVLENDLKISGVVDLVPQARASFQISGTAEQGRLRGVVTDARGATVLSKTYSGASRSLAHQFADDIVETLTGNPGIANTTIAFVSDRTGRKEIYLADYDGANVRQLTRDGAISVAPALSADGRMLAYTGYQSGYADIYTINLQTGARRKVVNFPGTNSGAAWSPDGNRIACTVSRDGNPELYTVGAGGGGARRLTRTRGVESSPSWSPDGREIVYTSDDSGPPLLFRIPSGGGQATRIPTGYNYNTEPDWSPDGDKIAFVTRAGGFSVAVKNLRGGGTDIVASGGVDPAWGANSRHILYAASNGSGLFLIDTQNGRRVPVISGMGRVSEPTWSR